ncbi:MAG TPA: M13 family metallopeptidase [Rhizobiaceae bacterium]|nr:M13 family metallopeptidase [Rhizobiaceae bacterium]
MIKLLCVAALCTAAFPALAASPAQPPWGVNLGYLDKSVAPGNDFFLYGNGLWMKSAVIPADRSYAGVNLEVDKTNEQRLKDIVASLNSNPSPTDEERKLRDLYNAFMDQPALEKIGLAHAQADLDRIAKLQTLADVAATMGDTRLSLDGPFGVYPGVDDKHPGNYSINLYQSGLALPDRDYYLRDDKEIADTRVAYQKYLAQMLTFTGAKDADARAAAIMKLEHDLAVASWPAADRRDAEKTYNPMPIKDLEGMAPQFPWRAYLGAVGVPMTSPRGERMVIVSERSAFPKLAEVFAATPVSVWRDYLTVRYLHSFAAYLPKKYDDADFAFYGGVLEGQTAQLDRATRGVQLLDSQMSEAFGKIYAAKYFPADAKAKADALVRNLLEAYAEDIKTLAWMTPETRAKALEKLSKYMPKIGYPDHWRDYSALQISRENLIEDIQNASDFEWKRRMARIDQPVDRTEWGMSVPTNNAYYNPTLNEIVFPAGILVPPFFDANADDAVNYGEIGATIGHEISHGFDDQGSKYDGDGVLQSWWTDADRKNFDARTEALAKQYDSYEPLPGIHINGKLTLGENIADLAGLVIAYKAYHISLHGKPAPIYNGYTGDQRFYLAYSQSWRQKNREATERARLLSNPHSPEDYRVNGVVRNDDNWYAAFPEIKPGDKYYLAPDQRVHLW